MTAPLTDEQVAWYAGAAGSRWREGMAPEFDIEHLAREVQAYRALRPDCPTCEGTGVEFAGDDDDIGDACPDCTDGKMPLDRWVALLVETLAAARSDMEGWAAYASDYFTAKHNLAGDLASVDAVLKMVPKVSE